MTYFDHEKNVQEYIKLADGFDGSEFVKKLGTYLPAGASVLELGMGPGVDLDLLTERYAVTGSDSSDVFVHRYKAAHPEADLLKLDASLIDTDRTFECIYSNKVLHHLSKEELKQSLKRQLDVLEPGGIALHTFWHGDKEESFDGLRFIYYSIEDLKKMLPAEFQLLEAYVYQEMESDDSICLMIKKTSN